ncbi:MAG: mannose-1-phosphate guanylyltransferase/mannose-6-phosphate isomerase [Gammaproteobacteria bacterium]|nr:MAG: mannose-1-phosphate guanylyltransferase/mannose-6-phosphate isomerase [Pseudomonadota bacterium]MBC6945347.1 mannose-1-phosphate guanylyltransferase/mannose-6-phosphate isomerase [Gammaproteobacteria bacterium]MCE7895470.1 mannose-1-phosphate guanylyltransferase/mannose-6-phosphate isomerase [Gammaproteobacteria bacterium PRO8]MDL1880519.1 mannose-1-phosphate guanylyltransferase/mannose-6-phosphate isomerase [Gammaproteobacteria bacterium PRO2]MCQ3934294.1 mannose-1-phosphate guanylyltr
MQIVPVILCGGSGTRLWPLSRALLPKQLLALQGTGTLLQETFGRVQGLGPGCEAPLVLCNEAHRFLVDAQLRQAGACPRLILEPVGRNTAPAVAVAALRARAEQADDPLLLVLPSDHVVADGGAFQAAVRAALPAARAGELVAFGVVPERPETGYGYIRGAAGGAGPRRIEEFVEKPDLDTARGFLASGRHFWNSGMFLFSASAYLRELRNFAPDILAACEAAVAAGHVEATTLRLDDAAFRACRSQSIDYAVMEETSRGSVVPLGAGWSDVGSWAALHEVSGRDAAGNVISGDVVAVDCRNSYLRAESRLVGVVGLEGCVVVETRDAVLVAPQARAQDVKLLVEALAGAGRAETRQGREVFRPWGSYDSLEARPGFQVKRLAVLPGAILSLQLHQQRAEHWVVVSGIARITRNEEVFELRRNEHTFIPLGARHRIENPGTELLEIIEVQVGDYLGEDDIVRLEDRYGRQGRRD